MISCTVVNSQTRLSSNGYRLNREVTYWCVNERNVDEQYPIWMTLCYAVCSLGYIISKMAFHKGFHEILVTYCDLVDNSNYNING